MIRWIAGVLLVAIVVLGFVAWRRSTGPGPGSAAAGGPVASSPRAETSTEPAPASPPDAVPAAPATGAVATSPDVARKPAAPPNATGIGWKVPAAWHEGGARAMRVATYMVGGAEPSKSGECAVFYFGPGLGGGVDENVNRWMGQFAPTPNSSRRALKVHDLPVTRVEIAGTYLAPGIDMRSQGNLQAWKLLGAIVDGPKGAVFFKLTGPAVVIDRAADDFDALIASLEKR